jgi:O-antigen ligase
LTRITERGAFYLTCGSAVAILFSIAVSQILLALAFAALLLSGQKMRFPPIKLPLLLFVGGTIVSLLLSGHVRDGTPQIRKFFVLLILLLVYSTFRSLTEVRTIVLIWTGVASLSALRSLFQFLQKYQEARDLGRNFYDYYVGERITGFMSHWMTFGGEEMIVLLLLAAYLFFSPDRKWKIAGWFCAAILSVSLVLGFTRSIFLLGVPAGLLYLLWFWRRWLVAAVPVAAVIAILLAPPSVKERVTSIFQPHGETDSNMHRVITRRTGIQMIRKHPLFGLGPEQVKAQFNDYVPADIPRPLPEGWYGHLHNIYLQYAAERGVPTALALFWMIGKILYDFAAMLRTKLGDSEARFVLHGAIAVILAILAEGFFEYNLGDSEVLTMFLIVVGFGYLARDMAVGVAPVREAEQIAA